jgi:hypothetical protein
MLLICCRNERNHVEQVDPDAAFGGPVRQLFLWVHVTGNY